MYTVMEKWKKVGMSPLWWNQKCHHVELFSSVHQPCAAEPGTQKLLSPHPDLNSHGESVTVHYPQSNFSVVPAKQSNF